MTPEEAPYDIRHQTDGDRSYVLMTEEQQLAPLRYILDIIAASGLSRRLSCQRVF